MATAIIGPAIGRGGEQGRTRVWLWSPFHDLFWIAGGASLLFALVATPFFIAYPDAVPRLIVIFMGLVVLCNSPHYAATYEIIYRERERNAGPWRTLLLSTPLFFGVLAIAGAFVDSSLPLVLRVFYTWSAYHYGAQHFGLASMYCARAGEPLNDVEKRRAQFAFVAVAAFQMILLNSSAHSVVRSYAPPDTYTPFGRIATFLLPSAVYYPALAMVIAGVVSFALVVGPRLRRGGAVPSAVWMLFGSHVAWFVLPNLRASADATPFAGPSIGMWIPAAIPFFHCAQYLGVVGWRARSSAPVRPILLWGVLIIGGWVLFDGFGHLCTAAFSHREKEFALVSALVNIHHFWIDGLIWKRKRMPSPAPAT